MLAFISPLGCCPLPAFWTLTREIQFLFHTRPSSIGRFPSWRSVSPLAVHELVTVLKLRSLRRDTVRKRWALKSVANTSDCHLLDAASHHRLLIFLLGSDPIHCSPFRSWFWNHTQHFASVSTHFHGSTYSTLSWEHDSVINAMIILSHSGLSTTSWSLLPFFFF